MKSFKFFMIMFAISALTTFGFGIGAYTVITQSIREWGYLPATTKTILSASAFFAASLGLSLFLLAEALNWLIRIRLFRKEFGIQAPYDPKDFLHHAVEDVQAVASRLTFLRRMFVNARPYVRAARLAEAFSFSVDWPDSLKKYSQYAK